MPTADLPRSRHGAHTLWPMLAPGAGRRDQPAPSHQSVALDLVMTAARCVTYLWALSSMPMARSVIAEHGWSPVAAFVTHRDTGIHVNQSGHPAHAAYRFKIAGLATLYLRAAWISASAAACLRM